MTPASGLQENVDVPVLWHPAAAGWSARQAVPFEQRHPLEAVGDHAGRQQHGHTPPDNHMVAPCRHTIPLVVDSL